MDAAHALFARLIDYAGLFEPAALPMDAALAEYAGVRIGEHRWMAGRFIVPASRLAEAAAALPANAAPIPASVIIDAGADPRVWLDRSAQRLKAAASAQSRTIVEALETAIPAPAAARDTYDASIGQFGMLVHNAGLRPLPAYVEFPRTARFVELLPSGMAALKRTQFGAKIRCGGLVQSAFPGSDEIAAFIVAATQAGVPFKATAGLHHPVRGRDAASGLLMHGFLNVLAAVLFAQLGAPESRLVDVLDDGEPSAFRIDGATFAYREHVFGSAEIARARGAGLVGYGSCSFGEPVEDLLALGLLAENSAV